MPRARLARLATLVAILAVTTPTANADVGGTLSLHSDARSRGMSYSGARPSAQLGLAWDGEGGWYGGGQLGYVRFDSQRRGGWLQVYAGRVFALGARVDGEAGVISHAFENVSRYDYQEAYAGLLGEGWQVRLYASPDYYGTRQRSLYAEFNARGPLAWDWAAVWHAGVLRGFGQQGAVYALPVSATRLDVRAGVSRPLGERSELQLAWVAASRGGLYTWTDQGRRRTVLLTVTAAF